MICLSKYCQRGEIQCFLCLSLSEDRRGEDASLPLAGDLQPLTPLASGGSQGGFSAGGVKGIPRARMLITICLHCVCADSPRTLLPKFSIAWQTDSGSPRRALRTTCCSRRSSLKRGGGGVLLTEILLPRTARQGAACLISIRG